jgi:hypothetical protein
MAAAARQHDDAHAVGGACVEGVDGGEQRPHCQQ